MSRIVSIADAFPFGPCVHRIREALAAVVDAAARAFDFDESPDRGVCRHAFTSDQMAINFQERLFQLAVELSCPDYMPARYPLNAGSPREVLGAVDWLVIIVHRQMQDRRWGWPIDGIPCDELSPSDWIIEGERDELQRCLLFLDQMIARHPNSADRIHSRGDRTCPATGKATTEPSSGWKSFKLPSRDPKYFAGATPVQVRRIDGRSAVMDLSKVTRWKGRTEAYEGSQWEREMWLCRSPGGRWVIGSVDLDSQTSEVFPTDTLGLGPWGVEIPIDGAVEWFIEDWVPTTDEERRSMPREIRDQLDLMDIDQPPGSKPVIVPTGEGVADDGVVSRRLEEADEVQVADLEKRKAPKAFRPVESRVPKRYELRSAIVAAFHDRQDKGESTSLRSIARAVGCSPSRVSQVLSSLKGDRRSAAPRGWKNSDKSIEAYA